jgi:peptidase MA superfamily protein
VTLAAVPSLVEVLIRTPGAAGPNVTPIDLPAGSGDQILRFEVDLTQGHIVPNTTFVARWRVTERDGRAWLGPEVTHVYADDRIAWKTLSGDVVRVHWSEGGNDFGRRALAIGDKAIADTAALLGVTETEPIDFYIYADQQRFYDALGPGTRENVGGQAHADIRTMFALITPAEIDDTWVDVVVPHELVHLVFATATDNPYHDPPHWLNEGLAVYLSEGYTREYRNEVDGAVRNETIMPLEGLAGAFPTTFDRFHLAYGESVSAVDHVVSTHDRDALVALIRSYATGKSDDEAFAAALGVDVAGFEAEWLKSLGASLPVRHGPQPAPPGPVPEGWSGSAPNPSVAPGTESSQAPNRPPTHTEAPGSINGLVLAAIVAGVVIFVGFVLFARRRSVPPAPPSP